MKDQNKIPYKIYLEENEMPKQYYNVRADMKKKPAPLLNPGTLQPMTAQELGHVFCDELVKQELDDTTAYFDIPQEIQDFYKMYRPAPLVRAYCLEEKLKTPAKIYYKFEGNNTSGSHKLNSAIAQAYYAKKQGLTGVTTETGAGQWGTALSMACAYLGLDCNVYMVKVSYEQKPFRREVMRTYGANVTPSPSETTEIGKKILQDHPGTTGSLGCAISEAVEAATTREGYRYVLGSVLSQVMLHQSIIGLETKAAMDKYGIKPDVIIGCAGGGSNLGGLIAPLSLLPQKEEDPVDQKHQFQHHLGHMDFFQTVDDLRQRGGQAEEIQAAYPAHGTAEGQNGILPSRSRGRKPYRPQRDVQEPCGNRGKMKNHHQSTQSDER